MCEVANVFLEQWFCPIFCSIIKLTFDSSLTWLGKSAWRTEEYSVSTLTTVFANLFMYRFQISGSWHSSFWSTSRHWVNWLNTSTTEFEKFACSVCFWNCWKKYRNQSDKIYSDTLNFVTIRRKREKVFYYRVSFVFSIGLSHEF